MNWTSALSTGATQIPELEIFLRLLLAAAFAAPIGFEREIKDRSAGLRTHMLTSLASAMFTILSFEIYHRAQVQSSAVDILRVIEAVTAGVSFLAAGTIIHGSGKVHGLTTGAGMWLAGATGVACGAGYFLVALIGVGLALLILLAVRHFETRLLDTKASK